MVQAIYETHPPLRAACDESISSHAATLEPDIAEAMRSGMRDGDWTPRSLALYTQVVIQGSFILAKAKGGAGGGGCEYRSPAAVYRDAVRAFRHRDEGGNQDTRQVLPQEEATCPQRH
jgi:O-acetyl-ADP-ribose deacetylase (regulator of RNase III)